MKRRAPLAVIVLGGALGGACAFIDQFPNVMPDPPPSSSSSQGTGGASSGSSTSASASGSGGTGGEGICKPLSTEDCYDGPMGTRDIGACKGGKKTCHTDGIGYGPCVGEVVPAFQYCKGMMDTNCDNAFCEGLYAGAEGFGQGADQRATAIAVNSSAVVITGFGTGPIDFGNNPTSDLGAKGAADAFLAAFDPWHGALFSHRFSDSEGRGVAFSPTNGHIVLVGVARGDVDFGGGNLPSGNPAQRDVFAARFDAMGGHLSSQRFGDAASDQIAAAVAVDGNGYAVLTGALSGALDCKPGMTLTSNGGADVLVAKLGSNSTMEWCASFGDGAEQQGTSIAVTQTGDIVVVGWFSGTLTIGQDMLVAIGATDIFVAVFNSFGAPVWAKALSPSNAMSFAKATGVAVDTAGDIYVTGFFKNTLKVSNMINLKTPTPIDENIFVVKLDAKGAPVWGTSVGDAPAQEALGIAVDLEGNAVVTGRFMGMIDFSVANKLSSAGGFDAFAAKLDPNKGLEIWTKSFGDAVDQAGSAVAIDNLGTVWLTGQFAGGIDLGGGLLQSSGASSVFLAKFTP